MTEEQIQRIKGATIVMLQVQNHKQAEVNRLEKLVYAANEARRELTKNCDHQMPDGTSAWKGGFLMSSCEICGEIDY